MARGEVEQVSKGSISWGFVGHEEEFAFSNDSLVAAE